MDPESEGMSQGLKRNGDWGDAGTTAGGIAWIFFSDVALRAHLVIRDDQNTYKSGSKMEKPASKRGWVRMVGHCGTCLTDG